MNSGSFESFTFFKTPAASFLRSDTGTIAGTLAIESTSKNTFDCTTSRQPRQPPVPVRPRFSIPRPLDSRRRPWPDSGSPCLRRVRPAISPVTRSSPAAAAGIARRRAPVSGTIPCNDDATVREQRSVGAGGAGPRGRTAGGPGVCRRAHPSRRRGPPGDRAPQRRGPGGRRPTGAPGACPVNPGAPRSGEIGGGDRLDPGARDPPPTAIVVRRQGRQPLRAGGGTSVVSPSPSRPLQLGSVVWAELEDPNGYRKVRPGVVVTPTADINAGKPVRVVAITTRLPNPLPDDYVLLPWDRQGKARSGLRRRCAVVASWQAEIPVGAVQQEVGILPPQAIGELLTKISAALPPLSATPAPTPPPGDPAAQPSSAPPGATLPAAGDGQGGDSSDQSA